MKYLIFIASSLLLTLNSSADKISCDYRVISNNYKCVVDFIEKTKGDDKNQSISVTGNHFSKLNDENIQGFISNNKLFNSFPQDLQKVFPNIKEIEINEAGLRNISKEDLKPYGVKLTFLSLRLNKIKLISLELFSNNPNLEAIDLFSNQIKAVEVGAFDSLLNLNSLDFEGNLCYSNEAFNDRIKVLKMMEKIKQKC